MPKSKLCESCVHTKVCMNDKNLLGDVFILGHPLFFDNRELYKKYEEREKAGFPCDNYMRIVRCEDCEYRSFYCGNAHCYLDGRDTKDDDFCSWGKRKDDGQEN